MILASEQISLHDAGKNSWGRKEISEKGRRELTVSSLSNIDLVRRGVLTAPPATPGAAPRAIQVPEIYPYHLFSYPDRGDLESCLSCGRLPDPYDKLLVQVLAALEAHVGPSLPFYDAEKKSWERKGMSEKGRREGSNFIWSLLIWRQDILTWSLQINNFVAWRRKEQPRTKGDEQKGKKRVSAFSVSIRLNRIITTC